MKRKREDYYAPRRGNCSVCDTSYVISIPESEELGTRFVNQPCPKCHYNPNFDSAVEQVIKYNISVQIGPYGGISYNTRELSELVTKKLKEVWPKR